MRTSEMVRATLADGGGTFDARTGRAIRPTSGYAVGLAHGSAVVIPAGPGLAAALRLAVRRIRAQYPRAHVGTWVDAGRVHVDPVAIVADRATAERLGRERGQLAVYAFATGETVELS